jgi:hypothetical protein
LGLALIAAICWCSVPPLTLGQSFDAQFTIPEGFFYAGQPAKTLAYQAGSIAAPFLLAASFFTARRWVKKLSPTAIHRLNWIGLVLYLLLALWCVMPMFYCPNPPFWITPPSWLLLPIDISPPFWVPARFFVLFVALGLGWFFVSVPQTRRNANRVTAVLLALWLWLIPSRFCAPGEINDLLFYTYHLNTLLDAMAQSANGHHWLVDFPHIYGGYGELLAPLLQLCPRSIGILITALSLPVIAGMLCLLLTARYLIPRPALLYLTGLALFAAIYATAVEDRYYGYSTARLFFPATGLLMATLYFRRPSAWKYSGMTAIAAVAPIWNLETGLVLWGSWLLTLLAAETAARRFGTAARHLVVQVLALAAAWAALFIGLRAASGQWPNASLLLYFPSLVAMKGYFCLRLIVPDVWILVLLTYLAGLSLALLGHLRGRPAPATSMTLMLSLLGIGIFSYFMGRSAPSNLVLVAYPAILLTGRFCAEVEALQRRRVLLPQLRYLHLPLKFALFWWAFIFVIALPALLSADRSVVTLWRAQTPLAADAGFIQEKVRPQEERVYFLSNQSGIFYYLTQTTRPLKIPGMDELLYGADMNVLIDSIRARRFQKLFVDRNFYAIEMYRRDIYQDIRDAVSQNYRAVAASPSGHVVLYAPR